MPPEHEKYLLRKALQLSEEENAILRQIAELLKETIGQQKEHIKKLEGMINEYASSRASKSTDD